MDDYHAHDRQQRVISTDAQCRRVSTMTGHGTSDIDVIEGRDGVGLSLDVLASIASDRRNIG